MEGSKEYFVRMRESVFNEVPAHVRMMFSYVEVAESNEYETHKDDENYIRLKKEERKAKNNVKDYLYNKRHNVNKNK